MDWKALSDGLLRGAGKIDYQSHPSRQVLGDYIEGDLQDGWRFADNRVMKGFLKGELNDWNLSEVSLHVVTCSKCAAEVAQMRGAEVAQAKCDTVWERLHRSKERIVAGDINNRIAYYLPLAGVTTGLLIFLINVLLNSSSLPCCGGGGGEIFLMMP